MSLEVLLGSSHVVAPHNVYFLLDMNYYVSKMKIYFIGKKLRQRCFILKLIFIINNSGQILYLIGFHTMENS